MIELIRIDDRLIHGQCVTLICRDYKIQNIITVDDATVSNPILRKIYIAATPTGMTAALLSEAEAPPHIEKAIHDKSSTLLLMKRIATYMHLREIVQDLPKEINIGPQTKTPDRKTVTPFAAITQSEAEDLARLESDDVNVYFNTYGRDGKRTEWKSVKKIFGL